jgi:hypothetical protein
MIHGALFAPVSDALANRLRGNGLSPAAAASPASVPTS